MIEQLVDHSQFTLFVVVAVLLLVGVPRTRSRYRIIAGILALLCIGTAIDWYATYAVGTHYIRGESHWGYLILSALFVVTAGVSMLELLTLRLFRRLKKNDQTA